MALERVNQTSRTILIEEFNPQYESLSTLVKVEEVHRKSEFLGKVKKSLEVNTFQEFVERFAPKVYEYTVQSDDPDMPMSFQYSFDKKEGANEVEISKHAFYRMVMDIYEDRAESGLSNTKTDTFKRIAELLSPQSALEQAKKIRTQLQYVEKKLLELKDNPGVEQKQYKTKRKEIRKEIIKTYRNSAIGLIPLALADTQEKLNVLALPERNNNSDNKAVATLPCKYHFDSEGDLVIEQIKDKNETLTIDADTGETIEVIEMSIDSNNGNMECGVITVDGTEVVEKRSENPFNIAERLKKDFEQHSNEQAKCEFFENLVVEVYTGYSVSETKEGGLVRPDVDELHKKKNLYTKIYKNAQEQFINTISDTVEKILGVKVFFDHASRNGKPLMAPLIVSNCKASALLESDVKSNFAYYIEEMGKETANNAIWFAIIPGVGDSDFVDMAIDYSDDDDDDDITDDDLNATENVKSTDGKTLVTMDSCKALIEVLKKGKITTFFNYKANDKTGFENFTGSILNQYKSKLESLNGNKYAVFTYPNFTLIPMRETCIEIGSTTKNGESTVERLNLPGVYVESSYVAAGLVVGSQDPYVLKDKGLEIEPQNACVRFDFEEGDNNKIMLSRMAREGDALWDSQAEELLKEDMFGFSFCGNNMYYKNKPVKNSYVYTARTMQKDEKSGKYKSLYKTLTEKYIILYLSVTNGGSSAKKSMVKKFSNETVRKWVQDCTSSDKKNIANNILREGENVYYLEEDKKIHISFKEDDELVDLDVVEDN